MDLEIVYIKGCVCVKILKIEGVIFEYIFSITIHLKLLYRDDYYTDINFDR